MRRFFDDQSKEHHHEGANLDQSCRSARSCCQETLQDECVIAIREESSLHVAHKAACSETSLALGGGTWHIIVSAVNDSGVNVERERERLSTLCRATSGSC